jgi:chemotaxis protein MotA
MAEVEDQAALGAQHRRLDAATVLGLGGGLLLIVIAMLWGGSVTAFFDIPAILIVGGGTAAVTTTCFSLPEMARTVAVVGKAVVHTSRDPGEVALRMIMLSEQARKQGILTLQNQFDSLADQPFLQKALGMVVDATPHEEVEAILRRDIQATLARHHKAANVLRKAAEVSPAMGLIGTLIGLVQMLRNLDDPTTIGPSMAVALLTTFYGAVLSNMVFAPLAAKLERNSIEEGLVNQVYIMGVVSISRQENPRRLEMLLNSILPPSKRVQYFD